MSNKYLYLNGELRGPVTMERLDKEYFYGRPYSTGMDSYDLESWEQHKKDWKTNIESLPHIPIIGSHSFKENQIYEEGKDFDIKYSNGFDIKDHVDHFAESHFGYDTSIHQVSIPIDQSHKGKPDEKDLIIQGLEEGSELWKAEYDNCRAILTELVYLKNLKDKSGKTEEYETRQPLAWIAAKKFLEKYQHH